MLRRELGREGVLTMRNSIVTADQIGFGGALRNLLWGLFREHGERVGFGGHTPSPEFDEVHLDAVLSLVERQLISVSS